MRVSKRWKHTKKRKRQQKRGLRRSYQHVFCSQELDVLSSHAAYSTVLNVDERTRRVRENGMMSFDADSSTIVCDNSANVHICNSRSMFVGELRSVPNTKVATIGGKGHPAAGIGTNRWVWSDENGKPH